MTNARFLRAAAIALALAAIGTACGSSSGGSSDGSTSGASPGPECMSLQTCCNALTGNAQPDCNATVATNDEAQCTSALGTYSCGAGGSASFTTGPKCQALAACCATIADAAAKMQCFAVLGQYGTAADMATAEADCQVAATAYQTSGTCGAAGHAGANAAGGSSLGGSSTGGSSFGGSSTGGSSFGGSSFGGSSTGGSSVGGSSVGGSSTGGSSVGGSSTGGSSVGGSSTGGSSIGGSSTGGSSKGGSSVGGSSTGGSSTGGSSLGGSSLGGSSTGGSSTGGSSTGGGGAGGTCSAYSLHPETMGQPSLYCPFSQDPSTGKTEFCDTSMGQHCCEGPKGTVSACMAMGTACPNADPTVPTYLDWHCGEAPVDCAAGQVCCMQPKLGTDPTTMMPYALTAPTPDMTCPAKLKVYNAGSSVCAAGCGAGEYQICQSDAECPAGKTCIAIAATGFGVGICQLRHPTSQSSPRTEQRTMTITITAFERSPDGGKGLARDTRVRWALEEVGEPYEVRLVSFRAMKEPAHLALHPFGQIPTYEEGDLALFETGSIVLHIGQRHAGLLPADDNARARAITWMFAAVNTVEPPILDLANAKLLEADKPWAKERLPLVEDRVRDRLQRLSARLGGADWLDGGFSAGDLMMVSVLLRLRASGILGEYPSLAAYVARGEARPAYARAFEAQSALYRDKPSAGLVTMPFGYGP